MQVDLKLKTITITTAISVKELLEFVEKHKLEDFEIVSEQTYQPYQPCQPYIWPDKFYQPFTITTTHGNSKNS